MLIILDFKPLYSTNLYKVFSQAVYITENEELAQVTCRAIRIMASDTDQRRLASRFCGEMISKAIMMDKATAKSAVRTISTLSKASTIELASALTHYDGKPIKILIRSIGAK